MSIDWGAVWRFVWPVLREALIAFLLALLAWLRREQVELRGRVNALELELQGMKKRGHV